MIQREMACSRYNAACAPELPSGFKFLALLGEGCFGKVVKCWHTGSGQTVAVKIPKCAEESTRNEISILRTIKSLNLDKHNIVKYIDCFLTSAGEAFVFESLDISLHDYWKKRDCAPMLLSDIRTIIQQMATAFKALKEIELIHTDVKLDNIMMVNHRRRPFEVKLIDFGLAISRSDARQGLTVQPRILRSPEVLLGAEFSEAIDMWTLGCAMFQMISGCLLFLGQSSYEIMLSIVELLGQPADDDLDNGQYTRNFFNRNGEVWRIKTPSEYFGDCRTRPRKSHQFKSLDEMKKMRLEKDNKNEIEEREQCIELLKAMLRVDAKERITPRGVLAHPFITNGSLASASMTKRSKA
ncbi:homeodomain-interacting protein kinase 2-like isoform X2 [Acanthopagrus latus]|uniref:homeodomain-interacting protein kinase 2-like isoform X2 n=1 Tax=Acanthopagrus latus TaxID=8177 RepID=UPI00187BD0F2|nr:homeodomain-interacting protein kinase 2-like isoform X2 [Acanthopagrus latus]